VIDPDIAFGYPVVREAGVRVKDVVTRFWAGERLALIADDFGLTEEAAEALVRAETRPAG